MNIKHTRLWLLAAVRTFPMLSGVRDQFLFENLSVPEASILTSMGGIRLPRVRSLNWGILEGSPFRERLGEPHGRRRAHARNQPRHRPKSGRGPFSPAGDGRFFSSSTSKRTTTTPVSPWIRDAARPAPPPLLFFFFLLGPGPRFRLRLQHRGRRLVAGSRHGGRIPSIPFKRERKEKLFGLSLGGHGGSRWEGTPL